MEPDAQQRAYLNRLPQDVALNADVTATRDLSHIVGSTELFARQHAAAVAAGDFDGRVRSCWGLIANGQESLEWVRLGLTHHDETRIEDAAGVLQWIGATKETEAVLRRLLGELPDGQAADSVAAAMENLYGPEPAPREPTSRGELFDGRFAAFTRTIYYVNASLEDVVTAGTEWLSGLGDRRFTKLEQPSLTDTFAALEPWAAPSWKQVWVATDSEWTAIFSQGDDIYTHTVVAKKLGCRSLRTNYAPRVVRDKRTISHGDRAFWFGYEDGTTRTVQASFQSRWEWHARGNPLPFEDAESYSAKRIPDRSTLELLNSYCGALGIRRDDPTFYQSSSLLVEHDAGAWRHRPRQATSAEWLAANR